MQSINMSLCTFGMYIWYIHSLGTSYCSQLYKRARYTKDSSSVADRGVGGNRCSLPQAPKQCSTCSNTHPSLASLKVSFHCIVDFKSACFLLCVYAARTQTSMHTSYVSTAQSTSQGPVCHTFQSETAKQRQQLAGIYVLYVCTKRSLRSPQKHTSEHVKLLGGVPPDPLPQSTLWAPLYKIALGPSNPFGGPGFKAQACPNPLDSRHTATCM